MYCNNCGKLIAHNSRFCQHCGATQDEHTTQIQDEHSTQIQDEHTVQIQDEHTALIQKDIEPSRINKLSNKQKTRLYIYGLWGLLHCVLFIFCGFHNKRDEFWPFGYHGFGLRDYDWTEFVTYVFIIPLAIIFIKGLSKLIKEKNNSDSNKIDSNQ